MKFLVVGPVNAVNYGDIFPLFMQGPCRDNFEILGMTARKDRYGITAKTYGPEDGDGWNDRNRSGVVLMPDGSFVHTYTRIIIRRRKEDRLKFLVVGPKGAITYKETFPFLRVRRVRLGARPMGVDMLFDVPPEAAATAEASGGGSAFVKKDGQWYGRCACVWLTNMRHDFRRSLPPLKTMAENLATNRRLRKHLLEKYGRLEYPKYDNYDAIEVPFTDAIPSDYGGAMGVPITFLDKWEPDGGMDVSEIDMDVASPVQGKSGKTETDRFYVNGSRLYVRLVVKPDFDVLGNFNNSHPEDKGAAGQVPSRKAIAIVNGKETVWNGPIIDRRRLHARLVIKPRFDVLDANGIRTDESVPVKAHGLIKDKESAVNGKPTYARVVIKPRPE